MTNEELINELQQIKWKYGDDLPVFCTSDHGQYYEEVDSVRVRHYRDEDGKISPIHPDDLDEHLKDCEPWEMPNKAIFIN